MERTAQQYLVFETATGFCGIAWSSGGITCFRLPTASADAAERLLLRRYPRADARRSAAPVAEAVAAAKRYFEGEQTDFSHYALDLGAQEPFFARVYDSGAQAQMGRDDHLRRGRQGHWEPIRRPRATSDEAMASNPVPLIIPCHRVLAAGGKVGGFSAPGGSGAKARMLALEGVSSQPPPPAQQAFGF